MTVKKLTAFRYEVFFTILFVVGIASLYFEIELYRQTLIHWLIPTAICILSGIIFIPLTSQKLRKYYHVKNVFILLIYNVVTFGGISIYLLMLGNFVIREDKITKQKSPIQQTGYLAKGKYGCGNPFVEINLNELKKELVFSCGSTVEKYKFVEVETQKGLLGFDVIISKTLFK